MNEFLNRIKNIIKSDPSLLKGDFKNFLYTQLISYNLGKNQEPFKDKSELFQEWIYRNKNKDNLQTFVNPKYPFFCQFANRDAVSYAKNAIKLYIPLDETHLYEGANKLFDYIAKEGIKHNSKIGKKIRNDNIVVRVCTLEEAEKVIDFVKNDSYIQEGLLNTNPFTINIDGVGIAKDGLYSYNMELCASLGRFINILVSNNRLDDLNQNTFHEYLNSVKDFGDEDLQIITKILYEITKDKKLSLDDFKNLIKNETLEKNYKKENILKNAIERTYFKYGLNHTVRALARFRYNGDSSGFTRDGRARFELETNINIDDVNKMLANHKSLSDNIITDYIENIIGLKDNRFTLLENAYLETYNKYGNIQAKIALERFIFNSDYNFITNNNNARTNIKSIDPKEIIDIIKKGLHVEAFVTSKELFDYFINEMENKYINKNHIKY